MTGAVDAGQLYLGKAAFAYREGCRSLDRVVPDRA